MWRALNARRPYPPVIYALTIRRPLEEEVSIYGLGVSTH